VIPPSVTPLLRVRTVAPACYASVMQLRSLLLACSVAFAGVTLDTAAPLRGPAEAQAAVSVAYSLAELIDASPRVVVAKALERRSLWETVADSRRIVTYTKLQVVERVYGEPAKTLWVRTLGGAVGRIGQQVSGEAQFHVGRQSLVFLTPDKDGTLVVMGGGQGHFPVVKPKEEGRPATLRLSPTMGKVLPRRGPSVSVQAQLGGKQLDQAIAKIRQTKRERDAQRKKR